MAVTSQATINRINELYYLDGPCKGVKSKVAKELGISAGTVSKYIIPGWKPEGELPKHTVGREMIKPASEVAAMLTLTPEHDLLLSPWELKDLEWLWTEVNT